MYGGRDQELLSGASVTCHSTRSKHQPVNTLRSLTHSVCLSASLWLSALTLATLSSLVSPYFEFVADVQPSVSINKRQPVFFFSFFFFLPGDAARAELERRLISDKRIINL